jgi:hypothetical protein
MTVAVDEQAAPPNTERVDRADPAETWSWRVFVAAVVVALPVLLWVGRDHWFFFDEWWLLARDGLLSSGYLDSHNGHWITVLVVDYRLTFRLWGLDSYVPYQVPVVLAHLGSAVLLRALMVRAGVRGWIASAAALVFVFFGSGRDNITYGFQLSLTGSLLAGLGVLLLSDRPGPVGRRDWAALAVGVIGLMTSSAFVALAVGVCVVVLLRRGVRVATFYAVPLGVIYGAWYLRYGGDSREPMQLTGATVRFGARMVGSTFWSLAQTGAGGTLLVAVALLGLGVAVRSALRRDGADDGSSALAVGLVLAWAVFAGLTALARANWPITAEQYDASRYLHVGAALVLPLVALGAEQLARRRTLLGAMAVLVLATGVPGNLDRLGRTDPIFLSNPELFGPGSREVLEAMAHSELIDDVPADRVPVNGAFEPLPLTAGWMRRNADAGRIPDPGHVDSRVTLTATNYLVLAQEVSESGAGSCPALAAPLRLVLEADDRIGFEGTVVVTVTGGGDRSRPRELHSARGSSLRAIVGPLAVEVRATDGEVPRVCGPSDGT